jgi:hypothetical protein
MGYEIAQMRRDEKSFPLLYSRKAVDEAEEEIIRLLPVQKQ